MSDKSDDILKALAKLKPTDMREVIENLAKQSGASLTDANTPQRAHLPNRLSAEDIIERARISDTNFHWRIREGSFVTYVSYKDASNEQDAIKFAFDTNEHQPWYPDGSVTELGNKKAERISYEEWRKWIRREST